jgi:asparagine synthase (glutamine-hydrolysing)
MCGICGHIGNKAITPENLRRMTRALSHRGPDDEGYYEGDGVGLGHRRLSIIDLGGGRQPLCNEDGTIWIVFNGEIYNFMELRRELVAAGHRFKTQTDTEVIIHLYEELGERCLERLGGMFAFAIWDKVLRKLFVARDRIGQKPLFYAHRENSLAFASETKAIVALDDMPRDLDHVAIHHYLSLRFLPPPHTMFAHIRKLPAGHYLVFQDGRLRIERYWQLDFRDKLHLNQDEMIERLDGQLRASVESHLVSDVPVGAFLSGGMDTSMVVAMMGQASQVNFKTFSIGVKEQDYNELPFARVVSQRYRTHHLERIIDADIIRLTPRMIWFLDEPSDPIAACMFHAAKLASENVKVVLGGDGGDELFAGFDRYMGMGMIDYYSLIPEIIRGKFIGPLINRIPDSFTYKSLAAKMRWVNYLSSYSGGERYAEATSFFRFSHEDKHRLFPDDLWRELKSVRSSKIISDQFDQALADDPIDRMLYADFMTRLAEHTLMLTDRMNMAHGLEARSPFLDHPLVELMARFPSNLKIRNRRLKYILRELGRRYLPDEIVQREKQGFMFPVAYWFRNELYPFLQSFFSHSVLFDAGLARRERVLELIEEHHQNKSDHHVRLWMLLNLDIWLRLYIDQISLENLAEEIERHLPQKGERRATMAQLI